MLLGPALKPDYLESIKKTIFPQGRDLHEKTLVKQSDAFGAFLYGFLPILAQSSSPSIMDVWQHDKTTDKTKYENFVTIFGKTSNETDIKKFIETTRESLNAITKTRYAKWKKSLSKQEKEQYENLFREPQVEEKKPIPFDRQHSRDIIMVGNEEEEEQKKEKELVAQTITIDKKDKAIEEIAPFAITITGEEDNTVTVIVLPDDTKLLFNPKSTKEINSAYAKIFKADENALFEEELSKAITMPKEGYTCQVFVNSKNLKNPTKPGEESQIKLGNLNELFFKIGQIARYLIIGLFLAGALTAIVGLALGLAINIWIPLMIGATISLIAVTGFTTAAIIGIGYAFSNENKSLPYQEKKDYSEKIHLIENIKIEKSLIIDEPKKKDEEKTFMDWGKKSEKTEKPELKQK